MDEKPKRRMRIRQDDPHSEVDLAVKQYVESRLEAQKIEDLRQIILKQEVQLNAFRMILFDLLVITANRPTQVKAVAECFGSMHESLAENLKEVASIHFELMQDQGDIADIQRFLNGPAFPDGMDFAINFDAIERSPEMEERIANMRERILRAISEDAPGPTVQDEEDDIISRAIAAEDNNDNRRRRTRRRGSRN